MTDQDLRRQIREALEAIPRGNFKDTAKNLLNILGYESDRTLPEQTGDVSYFVDTNTKSGRLLLEKARSAYVLFQETDIEIGATAGKGILSPEADFDEGNNKSFLFVAVEMKEIRTSYPRSIYADFAREVNKCFPMPVVVLFKTNSKRLTLAFVHRRHHKIQPDRDVLGTVSLVREINIESPHRAHLNILTDLSIVNLIQWIDRNGKSPNFDELLVAWLRVLDTEELNRRFYEELYAWFERAISESKFPKDQNKVNSPKEHIIRLITRLLFVWFIKEKELVSPELFVESQIRLLLKDYDEETGDSYYRAILQNLFFGTLNTELRRRGFRQETNNTQKTNNDHRMFTRYRYKSEIADTEKLLDMFAKTPFVDGGLFDCLDSDNSQTSGGWRLDCFTDTIIEPGREFGILSIPNKLFFRTNGIDGIIDIFNRYKFTVEENTPVEQEVALDPELLGKVFENLLASYNPETRESARKMTGSFYTPRAVVSYMVDQSLLEVLSKKVHPKDGDIDYWYEKISYLLDYEDVCEDAEELFEPAERDDLIRAIAGLKVIDPAVGSGAFPMAVLHKLTLMLRRLDPDNKQWREIQKERALRDADIAFNTDDPDERARELNEIDELFETYRDSDFGRKLYLIQNSIFGVDIQPIACQIAKLRFFISLAIEQESTDDRENNYGIRPLPNLETRFVIADTLLPLKRPIQRTLQSNSVVQLEQELIKNREQLFLANTRRKRLQHLDENRLLRQRLADALHKTGFSADAADKIAHWDAFDQNFKADWFDSQYMFGISGGFDIVIGNPPYIQLQKEGGKLGKLYKSVGYTTYTQRGDIYQLFLERGCQLLTPRTGLLCFITSNSWLKADYGKTTRRYFAEKYTPLQLLEMGKDVFDNTVVDTCIFMVRNDQKDIVFRAVDMDRLPDKTFPPSEDQWGQVSSSITGVPWSVLIPVEQAIMSKIDTRGVPLSEWDTLTFNFGIKTGLDKAFIIDGDVRSSLLSQDYNSNKIIKPLVRGRDVRRYYLNWDDKWLINTHNGFDDHVAININDYPAVKGYLVGYNEALRKRQDKGQSIYNLRSCSYLSKFSKPKLFWAAMSPLGRFVYSDKEMYCNAKAFIMTGKDLKYLCAILNSSLISWMIQHRARTTGMGLTEWTIVTVKRIPVPIVTSRYLYLLVPLVDSILVAKATDPQADISEIEVEIDQIVYQLYGLTEEEIAVVEGH